MGLGVGRSGRDWRFHRSQCALAAGFAPLAGPGPGLRYPLVGIVYGGLDALFLSVLPVLATWQAFSAIGWTHNLGGKIVVGAIALIASLLVTIAYHLGYPEYRVCGRRDGALDRERCDEPGLHFDG